MQDDRPLEQGQPSMPQAPTPRPPSFIQTAPDAGDLDDLLASFPRPSEWDESFDDLASTMLSSAEVVSSKSASSTTSTSTLAVPTSPTKVSVHIKAEPVYVVPPPLLRPRPSHRSQTSHSSKWSNEPSTPSRPFKRLREALSPKTRAHGRSPSKVPLPCSPGTSTEKQLPLEPTADPNGLNDIICAFRSTQAYLARSVDALELVREDLLVERREFTQQKKTLQELSDERRRTQIDMSETERMLSDLREEHRRLQAECVKKNDHNRGIVAHLEATLAKERAQAAALRTQVTELTQKFHYIEQSTDRRVFELQQHLDGLQQEVAKAKAEVAGLRGKLDEAEFAHKSLKEGGARLARTLVERETRLEELEKDRGKAGKRWGMI